MVRIDKYLSVLLDISRQHAQEMIAAGLVTYRGRKLKKNEKFHESELDSTSFEIRQPDKAETAVKPENIPLETIHADKWIAVINKAAGLASHPYGRVVSGTLVNALLYHFGTLSSTGNPFRPGIVHRLDRETSGLMVIARDNRSHMLLSSQFQARKVRKVYRAIVKGRIPWREQEITLPLRHSPENWRKMSVGFIGGRESLTLVRVKKTFPSATEVEVTPVTGRTHQIRVVLDFLGFPIIGDKHYGEKKPLDFLVKRHALHAAELGFSHPETGKDLYFRSPLPEDMKKLRAELEK